MTFAVGSVGVQAATSLVQGAVEFWVALLGSALLGGVAYLTMRGGPLQRRGEGVSPAQHIAAVVMLLAYIAGAVLASANLSLFVATAVSGILTIATATLVWPTLRRTVTFYKALGGVFVLLGGVSLLLLGVGVLRLGDTTLGGIALLGGVSLLLMGAGTLLGSNRFFGASLALAGVALLLGGVMYLVGGNTLVGGAVLLMGVSFLPLGVAYFLGSDALVGVTVLLVGMAFLLVGIGTTAVDGDRLYGVGYLLAGVAMLLLAAGLLWDVAILRRVAVLVATVAFLMWGVAALLDGNLLAGLGFLAFALSTLIWGVNALLVDNETLIKIIKTTLYGEVMVSGDALLGVILRGNTLVWAAGLLGGVPLLLIGVANLLGDSLFRLVVLVMGGCVSAVGGPILIDCKSTCAKLANLRDWLLRPRPRRDDQMSP